jgi:hypothetical protein
MISINRPNGACNEQAEMENPLLGAIRMFRDEKNVNADMWSACLLREYSTHSVAVERICYYYYRVSSPHLP